LTSKVYIAPQRASLSAIRAVEGLGGSVVCEYKNQLSLQDQAKGISGRVSAAPSRRKDIRRFPITNDTIPALTKSIVWYTRWRNRGYLAPQVVEKVHSDKDRCKALSATFQLLKARSSTVTRR
jgi:large subunit ribosomal protein L15